MILNGAFLGISYTERLNQLPVPSTYNSITFYGNCLIDEVHLQNRVYSDDEVQSLEINDYPAWDGYTLMLGKFDNQDLQVGNVMNLPSPITSWLIYRKDTDDEISTKLVELDADATEYIDYTVQANKSYIYDIFPKTATAIGQPLETSLQPTDFFGWYLVDPDQGITYMFDFNLESGEIGNETDVTEYKGYSQYSGFTWGNRDYMKMSIKAVCGSINQDGTIYQPVDYIQQLKAFINNKKEKLFKSRKGDIWRGTTTNFKYKYQDNLGEQLATISFDFTESNPV